MYQPFLIFLEPLLRPADRMRWLCLLLLVTLVTAMLIIGSRPGVEVVIPNPPWDKVAHLIAYGGFATLSWVCFRGASTLGPLAIVLLIGLMDEFMQYHSPGRSADLRDIVANLAGGLLAVLVLKYLQAALQRKSRATPAVG
jgi:VanZ family protein